MGLLDGKVAVVTGAGGGLGRAYTLGLAAEGAAVLVNDLGTKVEGGGHDTGPAAAVADEINAAGGRAVADHSDIGSFAGGRALVERAVAELGRVDTVVHSAGISRPMSIAELSEDSFEAHLSVHLRGAVGLLKGAFAAMTDGGAVTLITSGAGLEPRFPDVAAYASAKAAVYGLTGVAAAEGVARGIRVNAVSPVAVTRMSENAFASNPDLWAGELAPTLVAPMIVFLASELARDVTGRVIRVEGRTIGEVRLERGRTETADWTPETIATALPGMLAPAT